MTTISLIQNTNSPFICECSIVEETEKAYKLENLYKTYSTWIPKKALKLVDPIIESYTFEMWFRKFDNGKAISKAFKLFN